MGTRKSYTGDEKVRILRLHLIDRVPVSDLCDEFGLQPTVFYRRQNFFEHGSAAFERQTNGKGPKYQNRIEALEAKIRRKDEVLAELMEEHFPGSLAITERQEFLAHCIYPLVNFNSNRVEINLIV
jgi:transposase